MAPPPADEEGGTPTAPYALLQAVPSSPFLDEIDADSILGSDVVDVHVEDATDVDEDTLSHIPETLKATEQPQDEDEAEYRHVHLNAPESNAALGYCSNLVITSRFTPYNFVPKLLFYEFSKLANAYFLVISVMQTVKPISNTGGFPASLPALSIIVLIDMFFACMEDYKRHKADHVANNMPCQRFNAVSRAFEPAKWHTLQVGDVVKVANRDPVPADLVILGACEPDPANPAGICYVETKSLDGETNLKLRQGLEATYTALLSDAAVADLKGTVVCETPNNSIHRFSGSMALDGGKKEVITTNAIVLRGSTLRNTEYIYGLVVNTGPDTKIMMASSSEPMKWSNMERRLNKQILYICMLMVALCLAGAILSTVWNAENLDKDPRKGAWYLYDGGSTAVKSPVGNFVIMVLYYFLLLNSFIPVSLYVSMTSVKFMQSYFMNNDLEMYHEETDTPCQVRTMSLNEELGQIDYIFSDKTGTLTCNIMEFRKCSINGVAYGLGETEVGIAARKRQQEEAPMTSSFYAVTPGGGYAAPMRKDRVDTAPDSNNPPTDRIVKAPFVNYQDDTLFDALSQKNTSQAKAIGSFFEHLAVCHTVMPERAPDNSLRLSASSPDEQALVAAAACFGYKFVARGPGKAMVEYFSCVDHPEDMVCNQPVADHPVGTYEVLEVLEFNSTRKRMSVIVKGPNGELKLFCKGADTVMYERLRPTNDPSIKQTRNLTLQHMEQFASEGLRTLVIGTADIDPEFFESWVIRYRTAINDMRQIDLRRNGEENDIDRLMEEIEVNLDIAGATAIEDRLQAEVPDTIYKLRQASIKIWMLTGDKEETAINIGFACRLLASDIERVVISADTHPDLDAIIQELEAYNREDENEDTAASTPAGGLAAMSVSSDIRSSVSVRNQRKRMTRIESMAEMQQQDLALIIDGETLELALEECPELLLKVAEKCVAVIACRVSPAQKAQLVRLVRDNNPEVRTLAIGDGANDVSMIQAAHVGVGISGQEGMQAANSSDYAIAQFRFLSRLLLVHGRWNYVRMGKLILYIFYKNVILNLTQFWYMIYTGYSGQKFFLEWGLQGYNLLFTALPIVLVSTFEQDVPACLAHNYPLLYRIGQENTNFNTKVVWAWITSCMWESLIICFGVLYGMRYLVTGGDTPTMWVYGCTSFTIVLIVVTLKLCLHQQMWWPIHIAIYVGSFMLWVATAAFISHGRSISSSYWNGVFSNTFRIDAFWLVMPLLVVAALSRDFMWKGYMRMFRPSYKHLAQEVCAFGLTHIADQLLTFPPAEKIPEDAYGGEAGRVAAGSVLTSSMRGTTVSKPVAPAVVMAPRPLIGRLGSRRSTTRGSAFSYDAESVMVESFMSTDRYARDAKKTKSIFDRHASRGSLAFHRLPSDSDGDLEGLAESTRLTHTRSGRAATTADVSPSRRSAGNVFRGARHGQGRRRFFSVSAHSSDTASSRARENATVNAGGRGRPPLNTLPENVSDAGSDALRSFHRPSSSRLRTRGFENRTMSNDDVSYLAHGDSTNVPRSPLVRRYTNRSMVSNM
ncbi:Phospholipid-transporting ATPase 3 [Phytophthora rubi]|uniref:Phospholipid-transporting ATPase n=1 Tax=Phytophthora rubi TaxID=129364 RepID=A0A6A4E1R7_9STRA|nr:Phospholipid-transporting ATPase 3 [Phytophthora rubi]KAE8995230.1 Phospholipid-transporting ATPase 3 [Phytophthora rubi]KAE9311048.1 Phospholipid-transporting ATPase 3 [Phytophthora rubi]